MVSSETQPAMPAPSTETPFSAPKSRSWKPTGNITVDSLFDIVDTAVD
jgi:hypothetical protein